VVVILVQAAALTGPATSWRGENLQTHTSGMSVALADRVAAFREFMITGSQEALEDLRAAENRFERRVEAIREAGPDAQQLARLDSAVTMAEVWDEEVAEPGSPCAAGRRGRDHPPGLDPGLLPGGRVRESAQRPARPSCASTSVHRSGPARTMTPCARLA
jgi:hypothetical protein